MAHTRPLLYSLVHYTQWTPEGAVFTLTDVTQRNMLDFFFVYIILREKVMLPDVMGLF